MVITMLIIPVNHADRLINTLQYCGHMQVRLRSKNTCQVTMIYKASVASIGM